MDFVQVSAFKKKKRGGGCNFCVSGTSMYAFLAVALTKVSQCFWKRFMECKCDYFSSALQLEDKAKYDAIFDSLNPVNGLLSGDKVKPVLLNSKLPVDILGRVRVASYYFFSN